MDEAHPALSLIRALDRCEHGRHRIDSCLSCPGGRSTGNLYLQPGTRIGTDLYGEPIVVPPEQESRSNSESSAGTRTDPLAWSPSGRIVK